MTHTKLSSRGINPAWSIPPYRVECPKCSWLQRTNSKTTVTCFKCGCSYAIFPRRKQSRIKFK